MPHEIVVGVDTSQASRRAVAYACELARDRSAPVLLCHVIPWSPFSFTTTEQNEHRHERREAEIQATRTQIMEPLLGLSTECGLPADALVRHGDPVETLIEIVTAEEAKLVIVGRTGDSGLRGRVFGTLANHLIQQCPIPVMVVP